MNEVTKKAIINEIVEREHEIDNYEEMIHNAKLYPQYIKNLEKIIQDLEESLE